MTAPGSSHDLERTPDQTRTAAADSIAVGVWTLISRISGVLKVAAIGAVLGPTLFGNTYQFTNSLPNLVYYGFLAGSLFSSLLVPALVSHLDTGDRRACADVAGGFLGVTLVALAVVAIPAALLGPLVLRLGSIGVGTADAAQARVGGWLIIMFIPQIFCYAVVGTATAAMNACCRFALAAAAPALENIGIVVVLALTTVLFGTGTRLDRVPTLELLLLGIGTTTAVAIHAGAQWWGARRAGIVLIPRSGWRDPQVRVVIRRALPSIAQAGLVALQVLSLLTLANRVPGGVVAFQIALNFYFLAVALGATPVALSLLPRLSRLHLQGDAARFQSTLVRGYALALFVTVPAAAGYLVLAGPVARAISFGRMNTAGGIALVAGALAALSLAVLGQTVFMIAMYACYARMDTRTPLRSMIVQTICCLSLAVIALSMRGTLVLVVLGLAFSSSTTAAAWHLSRRLRRQLGTGSERMTASLIKVCAGAFAMAGPAWLTASLVRRWVAGPLGAGLTISASAMVGAAVFVAMQVLLRTPELAAITESLPKPRSRNRTPVGAIGHV